MPSSRKLRRSVQVTRAATLYAALAPVVASAQPAPPAPPAAPNGALTFGVTWKPALPAPVTGLLIRPEVRWDHAFTNNHPFNAQTSNNAVTLGIDAVLTF